SRKIPRLEMEAAGFCRRRCRRCGTGMREEVARKTNSSLRIGSLTLKYEGIFLASLWGHRQGFPGHKKKAPPPTGGPTKSKTEFNSYREGRRRAGFLACAAAWVGRSVAILRIIASTRRLSPSESVVLYFLISARKRISSWLSSPSIFWVSLSRGVS